MCQEMLPAEEPAIVVSRGSTIALSDMLSHVVGQTIKIHQSIRDI